MRENPTKIEMKILRALSATFDLVVIILGALTMLYVMRMLWDFAVEAIGKRTTPEEALHAIVLVLIFLEIFEIISMYVRYHHVPMKNVVEIGVLALVKELLVTLDLKDLGWQMLVAIAILIAAMGWVYTRERQREDARQRFMIEHNIKETDQQAEAD
ncbi:hypothetical protein A3L11_10470 [Thermococcus siculi]|uniref:Phosphate-starvation-inducible E-like protein n=1 Tax=Thermococcus siculi TaxID=72803 RepID=A0A2Z2MMM2_9EURY|nr:phosphate-starvation-inducible PsiE family protein [Thermococcus siculi]ASJ09632.1 hypothetical protein A3L11_10470 [Thermococcus siculi]